MDPTSLNTEPKSSPRAESRMARAPEPNAGRRVLITGGPGFLGVNAAAALISNWWHVTVLDNLSRPGTQRNLKWLITQHPTRTTFLKEDVRNAGALAGRAQ